MSLVHLFRPEYVKMLYIVHAFTIRQLFRLIHSQTMVYILDKHVFYRFKSNRSASMHHYWLS